MTADYSCKGERGVGRCDAMVVVLTCRRLAMRRLLRQTVAAPAMGRWSGARVPRCASCFAAACLWTHGWAHQCGGQFRPTRDPGRIDIVWVGLTKLLGGY